MKWAFWISAATIFYAYLGYPLLLWVESKLRNKPVRRSTIEPSVSIIIAAYNELPRLKDKVSNLRSLLYDQNKVEIIISSDGSDDGTHEWLTDEHRVRGVVSTERGGKTAALNRAMEASRGEIIVFTDARQELDRNALRELVSNFEDKDVGCVSGELMIRDQAGNPCGVGLYWKFEKIIRKLESATGSVMGATGAIYAVRRELVPEFPVGLVLDDVYCPVQVIRSGRRVIFEPAAIAWDEPTTDSGVEFARKVRTLAGNFQILQFVPSLLVPGKGFGVRFLSHKFLRLLVPWLLLVALVSSAIAARDSFLFLVITGLQLLFFVCGALGSFLPLPGKLLRLPATFCLLNAAAAVAIVRFLQYGKNLSRMWQPTGSRLLTRAAEGARQ